MLFLCSTKDTYDIIGSYNTLQPVDHLAHLHLKYILAHLQTKWRVEKSVSAIMGIEKW